MPFIYMLPKEKSAMVSTLALGNCASCTPVSFNILKTDTVLLNWRIAYLAFATRKLKCSLQNLNTILKSGFEG